MSVSPTNPTTETHSLLGAAEDLVGLLSTAARRVPGLQAVDGLSTAAEVAGTGAWEEAVWISGATLTLLADGGEVQSRGMGRRERDVRLIERVCFGLYGNQATQTFTALKIGRVSRKNLEENTSNICTKKSRQCNY